MNNSQITIRTNTAYLLNSNTLEMFNGVKEFLKKKHKEHWENKKSCYIKITMSVEK